VVECKLLKYRILHVSTVVFSGSLLATRIFTLLHYPFSINNWLEIF